VLGTDAIKLLETLSGTFDQATITEFGELAIVMTCADGNDETAEAATTTGELQVDGIATVAGTKTNELTATDETLELGIETTTVVGTELGTLDQATMATDGLDATITT
jgi:hypothetical protein